MISDNEIAKERYDMILYFTGTGNSAYIANKIVNELQDVAINLL